MLRPAVSWLKQEACLWKTVRTRAYLGRVPPERDIWETSWLPDWSTPHLEGRVIRRDQDLSGLSNSSQPHVNVFWEKERSLSPEILSQIENARFRTDCGRCIPQHVWYIADNQLFLINFVLMAQGVKPDPTAVITTDSTIIGVTTIRPVIGILPGDPVAAVIIATATDIYFYSLQTQATGPIISDLVPPKTTLLVLAEPKNPFGETVELQETAESLYLAGLPEYTTPTSGRRVRHLISDVDGRIFVVFEKDGLGLHELVYRREGSFLFPKCSLVRQITAAGEATGGDNSSDLVSSVKSAVTGMTNLALGLALPVHMIQPHQQGLKIVKVHNQSLMITIDGTDNIRFYIAGKVTKKRGLSLEGLSPNRRRKLSGDASVYSEREIREHSNGAGSPVPSKPRGVSGGQGFELASVVSLEFLASEFFKSDNFDGRILSSRGLGMIMDCTLTQSLSKGVFVLTIITSGARKIEIAIDFDTSVFQFSLLSVQAIAFPLTCSENEHGTPVTSPVRNLTTIPEDLRAWKTGPIFVCTASTAASHVVTVGLHAAITPLSLGKGLLDDGFISIETDEPLRIILDCHDSDVNDIQNWNTDANTLLEGSGLLHIGYQNAVGFSDPVITPRQKYQALFSRSFWFFFERTYRKVHVRWFNISLLPNPLSLSVNLLENVCRLMKNDGDISCLNSVERASLHPDGAHLLDSEQQMRMAFQLGQIPPIKPAPAVEGLSNLLIIAFWDLIDEPLLRCVESSSVYLPVWRQTNRIRLLCKSIIALFQGPESRQFISPAALSSASDSINLIFDSNSHQFLSHGTPQLEEKCLTGKPEVRTREYIYFENQDLLLLDQQNKLSGLVALSNLLGQVATLFDIIQYMEANWQGGSPAAFWRTLQLTLPTMKMSLNVLCSRNLLDNFQSKSEIKPLLDLGQGVLEMLTSEIHCENTKLDLRIAEELISLFIKRCAWLTSTTAFRVSMRKRLRIIVDSDRNEKEQFEAIRSLIDELITQASAFSAATTVRNRLILIQSCFLALFEENLITPAMDLLYSLLNKHGPEKPTILDAFRHSIGLIAESACQSGHAALKAFLNSVFRAMDTVEPGDLKNDRSFVALPLRTDVIDLALSTVLVDASIRVTKYLPRPDETRQIDEENWRAICLLELCRSRLNGPIDIVVDPLIDCIKDLFATNVVKQSLFRLAKDSGMRRRRESMIPAIYCLVESFCKSNNRLSAALVLTSTLIYMSSSNYWTEKYLKSMNMTIRRVLEEREGVEPIDRMVDEILVNNFSQARTSSGSIDINKLLQDMDDTLVRIDICLDPLIQAVALAVPESRIRKPIPGILNMHNGDLVDSNYFSGIDADTVDFSEPFRKLFSSCWNLNAEDHDLNCFRVNCKSLLEVYGSNLTANNIFDLVEIAKFNHLIPPCFFVIWQHNYTEEYVAVKMAEEFGRMMLMTVFTDYALSGFGDADLDELITQTLEQSNWIISGQSSISTAIHCRLMSLCLPKFRLRNIDQDHLRNFQQDYERLRKSLIQHIMVWVPAIQTIHAAFDGTDWLEDYFRLNLELSESQLTEIFSTTIPGVSEGYFNEMTEQLEICLNFVHTLCPETCRLTAEDVAASWKVFS